MGVELRVGKAAITLSCGDLTDAAVDAIVNAANSSLAGGGGVDGAIHRRGGPAILSECQAIVARQGTLPAGQAVITTAGDLPARYVIHTVGPVWYGGGMGEASTLASAYRESLGLAAKNGLESVAFPSISTGAFRYPKAQAATVALDAVHGFLSSHDGPIRQVAFVLFDEETLHEYASALDEFPNVSEVEAMLNSATDGGGGVDVESDEFKRIRVIVETTERTMRGYLYKPVRDDRYRLSDYLNAYGDKFLRLAEVEILDRGQTHRVGDRQPFVAISVASITYIAPIEGE